MKCDDSIFIYSYYLKIIHLMFLRILYYRGPKVIRPNKLIAGKTHKTEKKLIRLNISKLRPL